MVSSRRVRAYVDGFNFYYGLKDQGWKKYYWLDVTKLINSFLYPGMTLDGVTYFTARHINKHKRNRQDAFLKANSLNPLFSAKFGTFMAEKDPTMPHDKSAGWMEEKKTDVNLCLAMVHDVYHDLCDITVLVSADTDQAPTLHYIKSINPDHQVLIIFPPKRFNNELKQLARACYRLDDYEQRLVGALLPKSVTLKNGNQLNCPADWLTHYPAEIQSSATSA